MGTRDELMDMRDLLGEAGFINAIWAMRETKQGPIPPRHLKGWKYRRPQSNNVLQFTGEQHGIRGAAQAKV